MEGSASPRAAGRDARGSPSVAVVAGVALAGLALGFCVVWLRLTSDHGGAEPGLQAALLDWIVLSYILSGLVAWARRPESRFGPLMIAAGFVTALTSLSSTSTEPLATIGQTLDLVPVAIFIHVFLAFPSGRLEGQPQRLLVGAAYLVAVGMQVIGLMLGGIDPENFLAVFSAPDAATTLFEIQMILLAALALGGIVVLAARRLVEGSPPRRSAALLADCFALALVMLAAMLLIAALFPESAVFLPIQRATFFVIGLTPLAFLVALLDARLARSAVGELVVELHLEPAPRELRAPLARALHDPSLTVAYWLPQYESWADEDGRRLRLPSGDDGRIATLIDRDGEHVAALVHDRALEHEPELLEAVSAAAAIALENGQLQAELKARLDELSGSRGRLIEAGRLERQRLERNLHDGAQQRLIALSLDLGLLGNRLADDSDAQDGIRDARAEIAVSLDELRAVARGLHPAVLSGHGLEVAVESLTANSTVPVRLTITLDGRLREPVEVAAFYVVSESLANVGKHAEAVSASVDIARRNGDLVVEVVDDGIGGADTEQGSGLRGLADRVEALGGRLRVWTPSGGGTRVRAEIPCG